MAAWARHGRLPRWLVSWPHLRPLRVACRRRLHRRLTPPLTAARGRATECGTSSSLARCARPSAPARRAAGRCPWRTATLSSGRWRCWVGRCSSRWWLAGRARWAGWRANRQHRGRATAGGERRCGGGTSVLLCIDGLCSGLCLQPPRQAPCLDQPLPLSAHAYHLYPVWFPLLQFAGTRYRKRGVTDSGYCANDVEVEQVVEAGVDWKSGQPLLSSVVQVRGG